MNFYEAIIRYQKNEFQLPFDAPNLRALFPDEKEEKSRNFYQELTRDINEELGVRCDDEEAFSIFAWDARDGEMKIIYAVDTDKMCADDCINYVEAFYRNNFDVCDVTVTNVAEITTERFHQLGNKGDNNGFIKRFRSEEDMLNIDYRNNRQYELREEMIPEEKLSIDEATKCAKEILADASFLEELERIYSDKNEKKYYGNPVHYKISASSVNAARDMAMLLSRALKANNRLLGSRINIVSNICDGCYDEPDVKNMFELSHGNIVILDLSGDQREHGNYAGAYEDVIEFLDELITKNQVRTLCIFIENTERPGFAEHLLGKVAEDLDIIELKEGVGTKAEALEYIKKIARKDGYEVENEEVEPFFPDKKLVTVGETYNIYNSWIKRGLRKRVYRAYENCRCMEIKREDKKSEPYDELQKMIGLKEVKSAIDDIIDSARIQKLRSEMGMDSYRTSLHMIFTGNPGSAKTTVARLMAQIFAKEGILTTGKFVECGRADLVGKYVGWTAKTVRSKFREAKGGILFIDEAYSLVDGSNSFGDEAINTIVQEMENLRDEVIVVFAGYPEKMKTFLDKNEGLRSRIAFHLDFPDYKAEEMVDIFKLMADNKGYKYNQKILDKCLTIFTDACKKEEFGNGRFARTLLEQAMMAQARRITLEYRGKKISRKALVSFKPEDFDVNVSKQTQKDKKRTLGFAV